MPLFDSTAYIFFLMIAIIILLIIIFLLLRPGDKVMKTVKKMMGENKDINQILAYGKKKKWKEREVKMYYLLYTAQDYQNEGYNLDEIESMALDSDWPNEMVKIVLNKLR